MHGCVGSDCPSLPPINSPTVGHSQPMAKGSFITMLSNTDSKKKLDENDPEN